MMVLILTINVPAFYMARDVIILMRARSITRAIERGGPSFLGPEMAAKQVPFGPKETMFVHVKFFCQF